MKFAVEKCYDMRRFLAEVEAFSLVFRLFFSLRYSLINAHVGGFVSTSQAAVAGRGNSSPGRGGYKNKKCICGVSCFLACFFSVMRVLQPSPGRCFPALLRFVIVNFLFTVDPFYICWLHSSPRTWLDYGTRQRLHDRFYQQRPL